MKISNTFLSIAAIVTITMCMIVLSCNSNSSKPFAKNSSVKDNVEWLPPDESSIPNSTEGLLIKYGKELVAHTALYLGPKGTVTHISNGMNCQNCHLNAGQQVYANSFLAVATTYPKYNARSNKNETIYLKINDCFERSLNGKKLDTASKEMQAIASYIKWVGSNIEKNQKAFGAGTQQLEMMQRPADSTKGAIIYNIKCIKCHGAKGEGVLAQGSGFYTYPPLWGKHSYNVSAGIYRISKLAGFIKNNMPYGATYKTPQLTEEEAWDVAAYINSQPRNNKIFKTDYPIISKKPVDYPFGPYTDTFTETQHKYGAYKAIVESKKRSATSKNGH